MPPEARVFVVEDESALQDLYARVLKSSGHTIVASARDLESALTTIDELKPGEANVLIVDGNLTAHRYDGVEGSQVISRMRSVHPDVRILGVSSDPQNIRGADETLYKSPQLFSILSDAVTAL